jgi:hypothetical protein
MKVDAEAPDCACEACSLSAIGPVLLEEVLVRIVVSPHHIDRKKNRCRSAALSHAETFGMSTFRSAHATDQEILATATALAESARGSDPNAGVFGVLLLPAQAVKAIVDPGMPTPVYCIYDTALEADAKLPARPAHCDVFQRVDSTPQTVQQERRQRLFAAVQATFMTVAQFRNGLLSGLAAANAP